MPTIGWIFLLGAIGMVVGSLLLLRDSAKSMHIPEEKKERIRQRQKELEREEEKD
ncbi:MAG: DUF2897 family protein [Marinobacter sp.]|uniref:DUF2897 family protein n=1 Tax=Marinobacter sp. TaxID=50741 RepID=UPI00299E76A0|nr:DUF2897 family protein [Marinobacter sp.]MDX1634974.1 DUF2897 family protein [Marinobacter sp.]